MIKLMTALNKPKIAKNHSLQTHNTFGFEAKAQLFATVQSVAELKALLCTAQTQTILPLGEGSNILFTKDFDGLVIHNQIKGIERTEENSDHVKLRIGAGENWHQLVIHCITQNFCGIENLSLIPGTVGAAPIQNIGAYGVEIKDHLHCVETIDVATQKKHYFSHSDCEFHYRDSIFKNKLKNKHIVTHVTLKLRKKPEFHISYGGIKNTLATMNVKELSIKAISDAVIHLRNQKLPDPKKLGNAGSFFKNPIIDNHSFRILQKKYPNMPFYTLPNNHFKIPAAWLIEQCGFKGKRFHNIGVHKDQPLVLVNYKETQGSALLALSKDIQHATLDKFGIQLTPEVNIH